MIRFVAFSPIAALLTTALLCAGGAAAGERESEAEGLPGVQAEPPRPEPMQEPQPQPDGTVRIGNWDVRISGSVSYEIGTAVKLK